MIGTAMALGLMAATKAGSDITGAAISSHAANKATQAQQASIGKAMDFQKQMWGQQQQYQQPYMNAGANSVNMLGRLMTPPGQPGAYNPMMPATQPMNQMPGYNPMTARLWGQQ